MSYIVAADSSVVQTGRDESTPSHNGHANGHHVEPSYVYTRPEDGRPWFTRTTGPDGGHRYRLLDPDGRPGRPGLAGVLPYPPYRAHEVAAADPDEWAFVADHEADADGLAALGLVGTVVPPEVDDLTPFAGRKVALVPGHDGYLRERSGEMAARLAPVARVVRVVELPGLPFGQTVRGVLAAAPDLWTAEALVTIADGSEDFRPPAPEPEPVEMPAPVEIEVTPHRQQVLNQALAALANHPDLYCRGDFLATVVAHQPDTMRLTAQSEMHGVAGSPKVIVLSESNLGCYLSDVATFYEWRPRKGREDEAVPVHPPTWLIQALATRKHYPGIRPLRSIVECPYLRADGSIVETPGYDPSTGTLLLPTRRFPPVPSNPTQEDARAAWGRLRAVIRQFPFASEDDEAVWLAALETVAARPAVDGPVPGFAMNGNRAGCGKGLLIDSIGQIANNRNVPTSSYPADSVEAGKVVTAIALAGKSIVHFDNLEEGSSYGNANLDSALTEDVHDGRILGQSRTTGDITLRLSWFLSGNNLSPWKDAHRRWLPCNLVSPEERPEERRDIEIRDLRTHIQEHRGELVVAALTILRAHALAGRPVGDWAPLGTYERWDPIVRGAVWFATGRDCCKTRRDAADESPARLNKIALLEGWRELPGGTQGVTTATAVDQALANPAAYPTLHNAIMHFGRDGKPATARALGNLIRGMKGSRLDGMRFVKAGESCRAVLWRVEILDSAPQPPQSPQTDDGLYESEESSECSPHQPYAGSTLDNYPIGMNTYGGNGKPIGDGWPQHSLDSSDSYDGPEEVVV